MSEIRRIARLLEQSCEGKPYYGPSVLKVLENVTAEAAAWKPRWSAHSIWQIVAHLTAELTYARQVVEGTAEPYGNTWPDVADTSEQAWARAIADLKKANRALIRAVKKLDDLALDERPTHVRGPFYLMLHGTIQHTIFHAGQISLLIGQTPSTDDE